VAIVASGFRIAAWLVGAPSLAATIGLTVSVFLLGQAAAPDNSQPLDLKTYGVAGLISNGAWGVAKVFGFLAGLGEWIAAGLAVVSLLATLAAVLLYFTGRGIGRHATWARIFGLLILSASLLVALGGLSHTSPLAALFPGLLLGASIYGLWVLLWRFA